jgi:hypothetical protein
MWAGVDEIHEARNQEKAWALLNSLEISNILRKLPFLQNVRNFQTRWETTSFIGMTLRLWGSSWLSFTPVTNLWRSLKCCACIFNLFDMYVHWLKIRLCVCVVYSVYIPCLYPLSTSPVYIPCLYPLSISPVYIPCLYSCVVTNSYWLNRPLILLD